MRTFFIFFILAWLLGIILAVNEVDRSLTIFVAGAMAMWLVARRFTYQYILAVCFLMMAGVVWGQQSLSTRIISPNCFSDAADTGVIERIMRLEGSRVQYLVRTTDSCLILVTVTPWPVYGIGSSVALAGRNQSVLSIKERYPDYADYLLSRGIAATMYYPEIEIVSTKETWHSVIADKLRIRAGRIFPEPVAGLVLTMTLAQRGSLSDQLIYQFRKTGTSHILAISGLHMSLFAGILLILFLLLPLSPLTRSLTVVVILWLYVTLIGFPISALRAVWFWTIFLLALRLGWLVSLPTVALVTVTILISFNPLIVNEVSFQLSIAAIAGIGLALFLVKGLPHIRVTSFTRAVLDIVVISLGAAVSTAPVILYHFGQISLASVLGNLVVVPLVPLFLGLVILSLVSSFIVPLVSIAISFVVHLIWQWWNMSTYLITLLPGIYFENIEIPLYTVFIYYFFLAITGHFILKKQRRTWREIWQ